MSKKQDHKDEADKLVKNIKRQTRRKFSAEEKIRIVLAGLRGEESIAVPPGGYPSEPVLHLEPGVSGGRKKAAVWRHAARSGER